MKKKILVTRQYPLSGIKRLEQEGFDLTQWDKRRPMTAEELTEQAKTHHTVLCTVTDQIDSTFLQACSHLDLVSQYAVGFDNIDINAATRLGILVGHTPGVLTQATADIAFGLMITVARKMVFLHKSILKGAWGYFDPVANLGVELKGKTLGIFGMGRIGIEVARLCQGAYGMKVLYHNRSRNMAAEKELNADWVSFKELLAQSDILSAHCALTPETKEIFNADAFSQMKSSAIFINTARGGIHQEDDLVQALEQKQIWGAGLDVTNPEPMKKDHPLLDMENVCVVPHIGSGTMEARGGMSDLAALNIIEFYKTGQMPHMVNPEVLDK